MILILLVVPKYYYKYCIIQQTFPDISLTLFDRYIHCLHFFYFHNLTTDLNSLLGQLPKNEIFSIIKIVDYIYINAM